MVLSAAEKIRVILMKRNKQLADLADDTNQTRQNLSNKMKLDNFREKDLKAIAEKLNCTLEIRFVMNDTKEII